MKITGLITEYNPFHNGHLYHLETSRRITGADYCIALMSGSFVQRGAPAVYDKYLRTKMALAAGVDLVMELPVSFSTASAKEFAAYSIALFTALGADDVSFGSECGQLAPLSKIAGLLYEESDEFLSRLKSGLKSGLTFPQARSQALKPSLNQEEQELSASPNNLLGIEYLRAAKEQHSPLSFVTIQRRGAGYHDDSVSAGNCVLSETDSGTTPDKPLASASAVRRCLSEGMTGTEISKLLPSGLWELAKDSQPLFLDDFSSMLNYRLLLECLTTGVQTAEQLPPAAELTASPSVPALEQIADMTPDLASRIRNYVLSPCSFEKRIDQLKTKQLTYTRVSRALLHLLLNLPEDETKHFKEIGYAPYARILGFSKNASPLLSELKRRSRIPLVTKLADAPSLLSQDALAMLNREISAAHLYQTAVAAKGGSFKNEYTQPIIKWQESRTRSFHHTNF